MTTRRRLLATLRRLERALHAPAVQAHFEKQPAEVRRHFVEERLEVSHYVALLTHTELADIRDQLARLGPDLEAGTEALARSLGRIIRTGAVLSALDKLLGALGRVLVLAIP